MLGLHSERLLDPNGASAFDEDWRPITGFALKGTPKLCISPLLLDRVL